MEVQFYRDNSKIFKIINVSVHVIGAIQFSFGAIYDWFYVIVPSDVTPVFSAFGDKLKFLTYWDVLLQILYFSTCIVNDVMGSQDKVTTEKTKLCKVKDFIMTSFAFPIAMFVGVTFWGLMAVDRELVLPKVLDPYFPWWLNHIEHSNIVIWQLLELVTCPREYPPMKWGVPALFTFTGTYLVWMHVVYYMSGYWVYPIFDVLNVIQRILFISGSFFACFVFYYMGNRLNYLLWDDTKTNKKSK